MKRAQFHISRKARLNMAVLRGSNAGSLLADILSSLPLHIVRHCFQTGVVAELMAGHAPQGAMPEGMSRFEYTSAVRYGGYYHDIAAFLSHNAYSEYPTVGCRLLSEQMDRSVPTLTRQVILETVRDVPKRYDGCETIPLHASVTAIANRLDMHLTPACRPNGRRSPRDAARVIRKDRGAYTSDAMLCFSAAWDSILCQYRQWKKQPPCWKISDLKPN